MEWPMCEPAAFEVAQAVADGVVVDGVDIRRGSRMKLRPCARRTDAHDVSLADRTARVKDALLDADDINRIAVTPSGRPWRTSGTGASTTSRPTKYSQSNWTCNATIRRPMDAIALLSHDHRMVEQLFRDYEAAASDTQRRGMVEILIRQLSKHAVLEELIVYPLAKQVLPDGNKTVDERLKAHVKIKYTLEALDRLVAAESSSWEAFDKLMGEMRDQVEQHVRDDEGDLLPRLGQALDHETLDEFGHLLEQGMHFAPTRAHLNAPDEPPALALVAPVAAAYDRLRDRVERRPKS
jgi:hypothetical protein